ncbi:MAG: hypothetical protein Ct9H300mP11_25430 [Chloroflexota bacterium]|nr:MAG: hypothetical protein Ct9H300mP11_25430 [Chloroflexota bacterium]
MFDGALSHIRVVISQHSSGTILHQTSSRLRRDIIKVELPGVGDSGRRMGPFPNDIPHPEKSGPFPPLEPQQTLDNTRPEKHAGRKVAMP